MLSKACWPSEEIYKSLVTPIPLISNSLRKFVVESSSTNIIALSFLMSCYFFKVQFEHRTFSHFTFYFYFPICIIHYLLYNIQANPSSLYMIVQTPEHSKNRCFRGQIHS